MALVTLEQAQYRLRLTAAEAFHVPDVEMKMEQATEIIIDYIKQPDHEWTDANAPAVIQAAILEVLRNLFEGTEPLTQAVKDLVHRFRDPALA